MSHKRLGRVVGIALALAAVMAINATAALAADYTWTGADTNAGWTNGDNWAGGLSPTGTVGNLIFPQLTSAACTASPATATCYKANGDNGTGLGANGLSIDDNQPYLLGTGYDINLGAGGLTATPDTTSPPPATPTTFAFGFTLTAPQTWTVDGGPERDDGVVIENGEVTGNEPLTVDFTDGGFLQTTATVASLTASGDGTLIPADGDGVGWLNGNGGGNPVTLKNGAAIYSPYANSSVGALTDTGGDVSVGSGEAPQVSLGVDGALDLGTASELDLEIDQTGTSSDDYSAVTASGNITLNGAALDLSQGADADGQCVDLNPGDTDTLLSTSGGTLSGTFSGVPYGTTVTIENDCDGATQEATATIDYTSTTVTATIVSGGNAAAAPQNSALPTISGKPAVGLAVSAAPGTWTGSPTFSYQWYACTTVGCTPVSGATASTFTPTAAQQGDQLGVEVTATNSEGTGYADADLTAAVAGPVPASTAAPTISGQTVAGDTLTATAGTWSGTPTNYSYQWLRCSSAGTGCSAVAGAVGTSYALNSADVGDTIEVSVAAANTTGAGSAAISAVTAEITAAPVAAKLVAAPAISGNPVVGQHLVAGAAVFSGSPLRYADTWQRCRTVSTAGCVSIVGATSPTYVITTQDIGYKLRYIASATDPAGSAAGISSATTAVVSLAQVKAGIVRLLGPSGTAATLAGVIRQNGYSSRYAAPSTGVFSVSWIVRSHGHRVTVATFKKTVTTRGTLRVSVKLTVAGRKLLEKSLAARTKLKVTASSTARLPGAKAITASRVITLRG